MAVHETDKHVETFDMGEFSLDYSANSASQAKPNGTSGDASQGAEKMAKPLVKQVMKEIAKTTSQKNDEQVKEHQELVIMLSRYGQSKRFAEYLKSMGFQLGVSQLKPLTNEELKELLQRVKTSIDNKNVSCFWEELVFGVIQTGEVVACNTRLSERLRISGITDALRGDDTFLDLIEQVELENQNLVYTSPYVRLVYSVATSAMRCHSINSMMEKRMKILNKQEGKEQEGMTQEGSTQEGSTQEGTTQASKEQEAVKPEVRNIQKCPVPLTFD
jgi:hypothetical protein